MTQRLKIPPTKSTLLCLRRRVEFLEQGYTLLERKRELLTRLVYERLTVYRKLRVTAREAMLNTYRCLGLTHMRTSSRKLRQIGMSVKPVVKINILPRSAIGVEYPSVSAETMTQHPIDLMWTDASFDETRVCMANLVVLLARIGEAETALWRLLEEQRKTQKRVNALKHNIIPKYRNTIRFIESALEEEERNTLFQIKRLREQGQGI